jgi:hypothetical protein
MLGLAFYMSSLVDRGFIKGWPRSARAAWVGLMLLLLLNGTVRILDLGIGLVGGSDGKGLSPELAGYLTFFSVFGLGLCAVLAVAPSLGADGPRSITVFAGLCLGGLGIRRPAWFTAHPGVQGLDRLLTPTGTRILYGLLGLGIVLMGLYGTPIGAR